MLSALQWFDWLSRKALNCIQRAWLHDTDSRWRDLVLVKASFRSTVEVLLYSDVRFLTKDVNKKHEVHLSGVHCKELHRCLASISVFLANSVIFSMLAQCTACLVKCEATGYIEAITSPLSVSLLLQTFCLWWWTKFLSGFRKYMEELNTPAVFELVFRCHLGPRTCKIEIWHPEFVKLCHLDP